MATNEPRLLGGRYQLGAVIGYGGMAEVYAAHDIRLDREVAVKILRPDLARDPSFLSRFRREAQSAAGLNHPNIVAVYDTGEEPDETIAGAPTVPYIVMEFVAGRTLREVLSEDGRLLPRRAMEICADVAAALEYSHRAGIVHRDIKPGNVMLTRTGEVKVMDFGIARAASAATSDVTQTALVLGTAQYLSPEQARGEHVDARSDIYSAGCLLYELLTGVPPFQGESAVAVAYQHVREDPVPPSRLDPDLPLSADAVVLKAMAKNPANRYQDAAEMRADLERAAEGRRVEAPAVLHQDATTALPAAAPSTVLLSYDDNDRRGRKRVAYIALGAAVIVVFVIVALIAKHLFSGTKAAVHAPSVVRLTEAQAEAKIKTAGLKVGHITLTPIGSDNNTLPKGYVYAQSPVAGITLKSGGSIDLNVSSGTRIVTVPTDLVGLSLQDATAELKAAGLVVGDTKTQDAQGVANTVLSASPPGGTQLAAGTPVTLTVVSGNQPIPDVKGKLEDEALALLRTQGFTYNINRVPDTTPAGTVIAEDPSGGQTAPTGTAITLTISTGPATTPPPTTPPPTTPPPTTPPPTSPGP